jgi:hypothetical protein
LQLKLREFKVNGWKTHLSTARPAWSFGIIIQLRGRKEKDFLWNNLHGKEVARWE